MTDDFDRLDVIPGDGNFTIVITARLLQQVSESLGGAEDLILHITNDYLGSDGVLMVTSNLEDEMGTIKTDYVITRGGIVER